MSTMSEFLVNIQIEWPHGILEDEVHRLSVEERTMAADLAQKGHLVRMWRVPGRRENWGLWRAENATQLHEILSALPVWPFMSVKVQELAVHPVDPS
ncbi:muconolactone Delta-isomerase [Leucobacter sp. W1038]|uniref:muconolactone Delta-isomerase n=1 Tax=Leucobacter sp. W1038 TaxID=3438281 RepID=UPI003D95CD41